MKCRYTISLAFLITLAALCVNGCRKKDIRYYPQPRIIEFTVPQGFPQPVHDFSAYPLTEPGIALGKKLFHDNQLSKFNDVNCGSCHQQMAGFTQFDHDLGHGTNHSHTRRNPPGIFNMAWHPIMQWDGRYADIASQITGCLSAVDHMDESPDAVAVKLRGDAAYRELTGKAFGDDQVTGERIINALTQFVSTIVSADSHYDRVMRGGASFNESQLQGHQLFQTKCASCHGGALFTDFSFRNNGMAVNSFSPDYGRMEITGSATDSIKFRVPSLRNVGFTGYYGHDGRFLDFSEVITHYAEAINDGPTLDPSLRGGIPLSNLEKFYLQEFLFTLDDSVMINNPAYAGE